MTKYIDIDSSLYTRARKGCGRAKADVLSLVVAHLEDGIPMPEELQASLAEILRKLIPDIKNDRGFHENGFEAWEHALSVHELLESGEVRNLEQAFAHVAEQLSAEPGRKISEDAIKKHWNRFGRYAKQGEMPPPELLGDFSIKRQGKKK